MEHLLEWEEFKSKEPKLNESKKEALESKFKDLKDKISDLKSKSGDIGIKANGEKDPDKKQELKDKSKELMDKAMELQKELVTIDDELEKLKDPKEELKSLENTVLKELRNAIKLKDIDEVCSTINNETDSKLKLSLAGPKNTLNKVNKELLKNVNYGPTLIKSKIGKDDDGKDTLFITN